jgi:hypothetical protein
VRLLGIAAVAPVFFATSAFAQVAPPGTIDPNSPGAPNATPPQTATTQQLNEAEQKDTGRGLEFVYLNAEAGFSYMSLASFDSSSLGIQRTDHAGGMIGFGAGLRLLVLTIGANIRYNMVGAFNLWQIEGVVGLHIPAGWFDPYFALRGGYDFVGALGDGAANLVGSNTSSDISVHGGNVGISGGLDYYFTKWFSIGADGTFDILFLKRPPLPLPAGVPASAVAGNALYEQSGSSVGFGLIASGHLGLHF